MTSVQKLTKVMPLHPLFGKARRSMRENRSADRAACRAATGIVVRTSNASQAHQCWSRLAIDGGHVTAPLQATGLDFQRIE
jgi:hypothetical protein